MRLDPETKAVILTTLEARALLLWASTDETRPHLASVAVHAESCSAAVVDGHRVLVLRSPNTGRAEPVTDLDGAVLVPREQMDQVIKLAGSKGEIHVYSDRVEACKVSASGTPYGQIVIPLPTSTKPFPPVSQVLPTYRTHGTPGCIVGINAGYLADLEAVAKACDTGKGSTVEVMPMDGEFDPIRFDVRGNTANAIGIIMPCRTDATRGKEPPRGRIIRCDRDKLRTIMASRREGAGDARLATARSEVDRLGMEIIRLKGENREQLHNMTATIAGVVRERDDARRKLDSVTDDHECAAVMAIDLHDALGKLEASEARCARLEASQEGPPTVRRCYPRPTLAKAV